MADSTQLHSPQVYWDDFDAALFDLDGVITPTAEVHMCAWEQMFSAFFDSRGIAEPYTEADYFAYVDGKPRYDGVRSMLKARGIEVPEGDPSDPPGAETVCGLGNRKNDAFSQVLRVEGVEPYPGSVALLRALARRGMRMAIVSSSANARDVLEAAGLLGRFELVVGGDVATERSLRGKPAPDTFQFAAREVGATYARSVVFEDALSGVQAGRAGEFGLVVGVDRGAGAEGLREHGADLVVRDLGELT